MADETFLKWPFFEEHHRRLGREIKAWCEDQGGDLAHSETDVEARAKQLLRMLAKAGWLKYVVPKQYGGVHEKIDLRSLCLIRETLASYSGLADNIFALQGLGSGTITLFGSEVQRAAYLPLVATGEKVAAFALTEARSGSDVANMESRANPRGNDYIINAQKTFISNGGIADFYVLFARTGEGPGAKGISAFIVDADSLSSVEKINLIAPHPIATIKIENRNVGADALIGKPGEGFKQAMGTLDVFRCTVGAAALGFARRALDEATGRVRERKIFGRALAESEITQSKIAEMVCDVDASALLVYRAAWTHDMIKSPTTREAAIAKLYATEAAQGVIDKALQMFGGLGVISGTPVEVLYREIRPLRIYEGASELQKIVIARQHLKK